MIPKRAAPVWQHGTHTELLGRHAPPAVPPLVNSSLNAIIVPAARPAANLEHAIGLARAARCELVVLCSRQADTDQVLSLLAAKAFSDATVVELPPGYAHPLFDFETSRLARTDLPSASANRECDLSTKRNVGLILARTRGWERVFFMDDDIRSLGRSALLRTVSMLDNYYSAAMRVAHFPDNSVVCHAHRKTGAFQDVFVSGSVLAVNCAAAFCFFPDVYNEDWLFFYRDAAERKLGYSGLTATQMRYDPFADPQRAARQEFGDVIAEGLYAFLHQHRGMEYPTLDNWARFLAARKKFLDNIVTRAWRIDIQIRPRILASVEAARQSLTNIQPDLCERYINVWRNDLSAWQTAVKDLPRTLGMKEALAWLRLVAAGDGLEAPPSRSRPKASLISAGIRVSNLGEETASTAWVLQVSCTQRHVLDLSSSQVLSGDTPVTAGMPTEEAASISSYCGHCFLRQVLAGTIRHTSDQACVTASHA